MFRWSFYEHRGRMASPEPDCSSVLSSAGALGIPLLHFPLWLLTVNLVSASSLTSFSVGALIESSPTLCSIPARTPSLPLIGYLSVCLALCYFNQSPLVGKGKERGRCLRDSGSTVFLMPLSQHSSSSNHKPALLSGIH